MNREEFDVIIDEILNKYKTANVEAHEALGLSMAIVCLVMENILSKYPEVERCLLTDVAEGINKSLFHYLKSYQMIVTQSSIAEEFPETKGFVSNYPTLN